MRIHLKANARTAVWWSLTVPLRSGDEARLAIDCPRQGKAERSFCGTHDVENREAAILFQNACYFFENAGFVGDVHTHVNFVSSVERIGIEGQLQRTPAVKRGALIKPDLPREAFSCTNKLLG